MAEYLHQQITGEILGAAFEVHKLLGPGFHESIYEAALCHELTLRNMSINSQVRVPIIYKGIEIGLQIPDIIVNDSVIIELKAISELVDAHKSVVLSYLAATKLPVGLLLNFGRPSLEYKRIIRQTAKPGNPR